MIKKLRRKFIVVAMCSVVGVLLLIVGTINIVNYNQIDSKSDKVIEMLASNNGEFPDRPPESDRWNGISPETPFEARYFTALLTDGEIVSLDMKRIAAITAEQASEIVKKLVEKGSDNGMYHSFKYTKVQTTDGTLYILLDCSKDLTTAGNLLLASTLISLLGVGVVFLLIIIISKFVLRPVEDGLIKQKRFITNASHDIKTPLSVISAETDVLNLEYGKNEYTAEIKKQIATLTNLTEKLIFLSRMEEAHECEMKKFCISSAAEDVLIPYEQMFQTHNFESHVEIQPDVFFKGNEQLLKQMLSIMLDNVLKYAKPNGKVDFSLKKSGKNVEIVLTNDVESISIGNRDELFERFYRADASRNSLKEGNGIGLSAVKAIVETHKGSVTAESTDGATLTFKVLL